MRSLAPNIELTVYRVKDWNGARKLYDEHDVAEFRESEEENPISMTT